jgi:hypothetical protein
LPGGAENGFRYKFDTKNQPTFFIILPNWIFEVELMKDDQVLDMMNIAMVVLMITATIMVLREHWLGFALSVMVLIGLFAYSKYLAVIIEKNKEFVKEEEKKQKVVEMEMARAKQMADMQEALKKMKRGRT